MTGPYLWLLAAAIASPAALTAQQARRQPNVIRLEEIRTIHVDNAYQIVERLRPRLLAQQTTLGSSGGVGSHTTPPVTVYVGMSAIGGIDKLASIPAETVREVRYLDAGAARVRFGLPEGRAIVVTPR
jgi:hypothetical protein